MNKDISKNCADSLRTFTKEKYNIKLKAAHAHELVAAYFGYSSKNAMLADTKYPISNLGQAEIVVMMPDSFIDQRRNNLQDLSPELPDSYTLGEAIYTALFSDEWWKSQYPPFRSFEKLAKYLVENNDAYQSVFSLRRDIPAHHIVVVKDDEDSTFEGLSEDEAIYYPFIVKHIGESGEYERIRISQRVSIRYKATIAKEVQDPDGEDGDTITEYSYLYKSFGYEEVRRALVNHIIIQGTEDEIYPDEINFVNITSTSDIYGYAGGGRRVGGWGKPQAGFCGAGAAGDGGPAAHRMNSVSDTRNPFKRVAATARALRTRF